MRSPDFTKIKMQDSLPFAEFMDAVFAICRKPLTGLFHDCLDYVYMSSKKRHISISGPYLLNLFRLEDVHSRGLVSFEAFENIIKTGLIYSKEDVSALDVEFLTTRYLTSTQSNQYQKLVSFQ